MQWLIKRCVDESNTSVSIVRKTMPAIRRSVYRDFVEIINDWALWNDKQMNKSEFIYTFDNGSWIEFFSCENEQKMRGSKRSILFVNEANELAFIEWQQLQMRTTRFSILDYNPSFSEEHWINQVNSERKTYHFISTYKDNPFLEQKVIDEIESLQWKNKSLWQVYGLGMQAIVEGLIFPAIAVVDYVPREAARNRYIGMDFGYEHDPTAIVEVCLWGSRLYVRELCYRTHMLTNDIIAELKKIQGTPEIISESADPRLVDEIYNAGLDIHPVHKFGGSIMAGITKMQEYEIIVTSDSVNAIKEFKNYTYRQDKEGKWLNEPIDAYNHCFTGDTLIVTANGNKRIDSLKEGELVLTSSGVHKVTKLFNQGHRKIWHTRMCLGNFVVEIKATKDHKFKTTKGWKTLEELKEGDTLFLCKCLTEKNTGYIPVSGISREAQSGYTELCGSITTDQFRKGITSTIKTKTLLTTASKICNLLKATNIYTIISKNCLKTQQTFNVQEKRWHTPRSLQKNGTGRKRGGNGTASTAGSKLLAKNISQRFANAVEKSTAQRQSEYLVSAPIIASLNGAGTTTVMTKSECANIAGKNSQSASTTRTNFAVEVVLENITVLEERIAETFDIEVEGAHEFFANGVLAHNCIDSIRYVILEKILGAGASGMDASGILGLLG